MLAAFLQFEDETVLVVGLSHDDLASMAMGSSPPPMDIAGLAASMGTKLPTRLQILVGRDDESIQARIQDALGETRIDTLPADEAASHIGLPDTPEETAAAESEDLAIRKAKARYN